MALPLPSYIKKALQFESEILEFQNYVREIKPTSYLEIGCKFGGSLYLVSKAMAKGSRIVALSLPNTDGMKALTQTVNGLAREGYDTRLIWGDSSKLEIVRQAIALGPYDLIFIDGDHSERGVRADFWNYGPLGKVICFHDVNSDYMVNGYVIECKKVWQDIKQTHKEKATFREICHDKGHNGIGIMQWLA